MMVYYAVFSSFSANAASCFFPSKAFLRSPCRLICAAYWQSLQQNLTFDLVVVKVLPAVFADRFSASFLCFFHVYNISHGNSHCKTVLLLTLFQRCYLQHLQVCVIGTPTVRSPDFNFWYLSRLRARSFFKNSCLLISFSVSSGAGSSNTPINFK